jgi:uncharacterized protein YdcH (DUF465 family)
MSNQTEDIQQILAREDNEFSQWIEEHHKCEERLTALAAKAEVSTEEDLEEKRLKKRKLYLKDQMAMRIRDYSSANATA